MQVVYFAAALQVIGVALAGYSQYFYSAPLAAGYYQGDYHQYEPQQIFPQPNFYNAIPQVPQYQYQQPFFPAQTFGYHVAPVRAINVQENANVKANTAAPSRGNEPQQESTFNFVRKEADNFRGFAYHTEFDHGARSDVVFITGPEIHNIQTEIKQQNSRTTASDSVDSNAGTQQDNESIEQLPMSIEALVNFIRNPEVGVREFYSIDNALVARKSEDYLQYPANTIPLATPTSPIYNVLRANFNGESKSEETESKPEEKFEAKEEQVVSASETKSNTVQPEVSSTEASSTEAVSSSTETTTTEAASSSSTTTVQVTSTTTTTESVKSTMGTIIVADEEDTPKKS